MYTSDKDIDTSFSPSKRLDQKHILASFGQALRKGKDNENDEVFCPFPYGV
jgi:hypothetical protein